MPFSFATLPVPESVVDSLRILSANKSPFFATGAMLFEEVAGGAGNFAARRFALEDAEHDVVVTGAALTPGRIGHVKDVSPVLRRARPRRIVDGEAAAQGGLLAESPTAALLDSTAAWWAAEWDLATVAMLSAAFGAGGPLENTHVYDIASTGGAAVRMNFNAVVDAGGILGDAASGLVTLVCHSRVANDLIKEAGSKPVAIPVGAAPYAVDIYAGRARVVVSDGVEVSGDVDDPATVFTSYLLSNGCLWTSVQQAFTEYAVPNPAIPSLDVTQTEHRVIGVGGLSCAAGMPVNPSNSDLATAANWALTINPMTTSSRKGIGVVAIKTNATVPG